MDDGLGFRRVTEGGKGKSCESQRQEQTLGIALVHIPAASHGCLPLESDLHVPDLTTPGAFWRGKNGHETSKFQHPTSREAPNLNIQAENRFMAPMHALKKKGGSHGPLRKS